jgi:GT2 family glycosyltransferase
VLGPDGSLDFSQRRFPRHRSTFAQALFLHRIFPGAAWSDELVRDPRAYETSHATEWIAGVCVMVSREALERVGGWSEAFFMYGEDKDLCRRLWDTGYEVRFVAEAEVVHIGGVSRPRAELLPTLAASTIRYAQIHEGRASAAATRTGVALGAFTHALLTTRGRATRIGHLRALGTACSVRSRPAAQVAGALEAQPPGQSGAPSLNGGRQAG